MSDNWKPKGQHVNIDPDHPKALGICDYTGFVHMRHDLVQQMEWRGNALVWTGFLVGKDYLDQPNPQLRPPILPPDPVPIQQPRPPQEQNITWNQGIGVIWNNLTTVTFSEWGTLEDGMQTQSQSQILQQLQTYNWGL